MNKFLKKKNIFKFLAITLVISLLVGISIKNNNFKVEASEEYYVEEKNNFDSSKYMDYIRFNENDEKFEITNEGYKSISKEEIDKIEQVMGETNEALKYIDLASEEVTIVDCDNYKDVDEKVSRKKYKEGVNDIKIDFHMVTVKLSKTTVNTIGAGVSIGGIWIPEGIVSKVIASLGVVGCACPGGIWFKVSLLTLVPPLTIAGLTFTRAGFQ